MADADLDALIANNLADLDAAVRRVWFTLQPAVAEAMDEIINQSRERANWDGEGDWNESGSWLAPFDWKKLGDISGDAYKCQFGLEAGSGDTMGELDGEDAFWLTRLLGIGDGRLGFWWRRNDVGKKAWRKLVGEQSDLITALRAKGFEYQEISGSFCLPVKIDQAALVAALKEETPVEAMEPLKTALQKLIDAKPDFDALLLSTASID
jgi:hypothetical protein